MRVNIDRTVEVTDEQRAAIAKMLGQKSATRADIQQFVWTNGAPWALALQSGQEVEPADEDLIEAKAPTFDPNDLI